MKSRLMELLAHLSNSSGTLYEEAADATARAPVRDVPGGGDFCSIFPCSMFNSAAIILQYLLLTQCPGTNDNSILSEQVERSKSIVHSVARARKETFSQFNQGSYLHVIFLLEVVSSYSMSAEPRTAAQKLLDQLR
jgi:hypothetical protein